MTMFEKIEKIKEYLVLAIVFLFPFVFAGPFIDQTQLPKLIILGLLLCLILITVAVQIYFAGKVQYGKGRFDLAIFVIVAAYLLSAIFMTPSKVEAFFVPGSASIIIGLGIVYFFINSTLDKGKLKMALIASAAVVSILTLFSFLGVFEKISQLPAFIKTTLFNPTGDYLTGGIFLAAVAPFAVTMLIKETKMAKKLAAAFSLVFILIALGISIFSLMAPERKAAPLLPPFETSWAVGIDTIRESPLLGAGPGNYLTAFNRFRPISYNSTPLWNIKFSTGRNWYLTVLTETGLLGVVGLALLGIAVFKLIDKNLSIYKESKSLLFDPVSVAVLVGLLGVLFIFPASVPVIFLVFVVLALNSQAKIRQLTFEGAASNTPKLLISIFILVIVAFFGFKAWPILMAESDFKQANDSLIANDGKRTYDLLQSSINLNPWVDRYHASYAQVNLAIARSIVGSVKDTKDLTDDQRNTILQLIQQSIREGQNTVSLNPTRSANWQVLANIYQVVIPYATQAGQFAVQSYNQAINLDPIDPNLRIALGGTYYSLGQYDAAINVFQTAIAAKQDLPNAYYNLAAALVAKNDFTDAIAAMNTVISLLPKDSPDYKTAQNDLDTLQRKQKSLQDTSSSTNLTSPQKQAPAINPSLQLPESASPPTPAPIATHSPVPVATIVPIPTQTPLP